MINFVVFYLVNPIVWLISKLPFRVLYFISDGIYLIIYYVVGYRKKVVLQNLQLAFPNYTLKQQLQIRKKFYHHFVDIFIEMIKSFTVSKEEIYKRYTFTNIDFFDDLYNDGKSVILMGSHYANWEWIMSLDSFVKYQGYAAYTKINNPYFNDKVLKSRAKFGTHLIQTSKIINQIVDNQQNKVQAMYGLLSDQSPQIKKTLYWQKFLGVKVPIHTGAEMLAKKFDMNVVFMDVKKVKRGYYETSFSLITNKANSFPDYAITDIFLDKVEQQIRTNPAYYFWTHKRFKHKNKVPNS